MIDKQNFYKKIVKIYYIICTPTVIKFNISNNIPVSN